MKAIKRNRVIEWVLCVAVVAGVTIFSLRDSLQEYDRLIEEAKQDSIREAQSIEVLKKAMRTGYIDTTGNGQGINVNVVDTNRY
jgi:hypothetical protein